MAKILIHRKFWIIENDFLKMTENEFATKNVQI